MSSPHGFKPTPNTPSAKDSPTSIFFNNLSPIKVTSSRLSSQAFDNVDVPSPPPVFATPQNRLINSKMWKRSENLAFPGSQKICPGDADLVGTSLEYPDATIQFIPVAAAQLSNSSDKQYNNDHHPQDEVCRGLSNGVDDFFSIPSEDCENTSCSPGFFLGEADDLVRDKEITPFSSNGDQMAFFNADSAQFPAVKSAATVTNSVAEYTKHLNLVSTPNLQPNKDALPQEFPKNSIAYEGSNKEFLISNAGDSSNLNIVDQSSSCQPEKDISKKKPSNRTVPAAFEEIEKKGGLLGKKIEANLKSFVDLISSTQNEPITPDSNGSNHSGVPNNMNFKSICHVNEHPSTSSSCLLKMQDVNLFSSRTDHLGKLGCIYEEKCEIPRNIQSHANHLVIASQMRDASGMSQIPYYQEDLTHHSRGMYKRLQFEDVEKHEQSIADSENYMKLKSPRFMSERTTMASNMESQYPSTTNSSCRIQTTQSLSGNISCNYLVKTNSSEQSKGRFTAVAHRSSGIGLHLNAIGMPGKISGHIDMKMAMESLGVEGKTCFHNTCEAPSQILKNMIVSRNGTGEVSLQLISNSEDSSFGSKDECNNDRLQKSSDSAPDYHSALDVEPLDMRMQPEFSDHHITPCSRKRQHYVEASQSEDSAQTTLGRKRKKDPEIEGQKRCNCKRSKCLKLYCDCFAAGMFCNKTCSCQGCSNNSENEEMVSSTRQLIETRNPLAFAPKVVHAHGDLKENADNKHITPPSARHKRGCNCKKSKCLKKYCECYQAGVGCSLGCRCEGCRNAYGTKEAYGDISEIVVEHQKPKEDSINGLPSVEALKVVEGNSKEASNTKQFTTHFTSPAPLVQDTNINSVARLQLPASYHPSSKSSFATLSSFESPTSTMTDTRSSAHEEKNEQTLSLIPYNQKFDSSSGLNVDSLSPGWNISPSSVPSQSLCGSTTLRTKQAKALGEGKFIIKPATDEPNYNLAEETPDILKDTHSPINTVKTSSPNQKRVSPPKTVLHEAGSSFSPGLRSGRKYVLQSIPQFPSLTPYRNNMENKDN
ncbi:uncharacterized protein LOC110101867 [Dendrobium catenatum]|uniref:uncharacterized protein LOC110101867 n=1 Tax=Dendrobium catenatum TaxID=906689 RepID=UPI0009F55909|nr:uncharacterized protein LOC110101867 [Dendrobium catenatum]